MKTKNLFLPFLILLIVCHASFVSAQNWPQAAGPNGDWTTVSESEIPTDFNVATGKNVLWKKALDESGQSGIVVWKDRIFLTILKPFDPKTQKDKKTSDIVGLCLDASNGETIWKYEIESDTEAPYMYGFSDLTSPSPITDGERVWFFNAGGKMVCLDWDGSLVWERTWRSENEVLQPKKRFPFNKQFEPFLVGDTIIHSQPFDPVIDPSDGKRDDAGRKLGWHYLHALDKKTGEEKWISQDALTHYNTPGHSLIALGKPTALIGRGGYHKVPESPIGYSMIDLENGKRIWASEMEGKKDTALSNACFNKNFAVWISETGNQLTVLDASNGEKLRTIDLRTKVDLRTYDTLREQYKLEEDLDLTKLPKSNIFPAWFTNFIDGDHFYFMCFNDDVKDPKFNRFSDLLPLHCFTRVNLRTGKVEILEVPVHVNDRKGYLWKEELKTTALNSKGLDVVSDIRSKRDGWWWCFNGNPIKVNDTLLFTTMIGNCYTFKTNTDSFDEDAFLSLNPLGPRGESWSLNTPSVAGGKIYHRTAKELICIGNKKTIKKK